MTTTERDTDCPPGIGLLEWKSLPTGVTSSEITGVLGHDDKEGTITAIVAISGVPDKVGDVIVPGSLGVAVKRLKPKGVDSHDWKTPVSRADFAQELMPGDSRLPKATPDGEPWPVNAGGLLVKARYNLATSAGRDAYENAKFFGPEQSFSIGYKVRPGGARMRGGKRHLHDYDLYEYSQVLHGAHPLAHLTGVKSLLAPETVGDQWYDDPRSGLTAVEGIQTKVRYVHNAEFWKLPVGTPIKPGMRPKGVTSRSSADIGHAPGEPSPAGTDPQATAVAHLTERMAELKGSGSPSTIASANLLSPFTLPGADVHSSPDSEIAALNTGKVWVLLDTANGSPLPTLPGNTPPAQVDDALTEIAALPIPWDDPAARVARWKTPGAKEADQASVQAIIARHAQGAALGQALGAGQPPKADPVQGAQQAREDAEGAITDGNRDELADALTRMGLSEDQDPHDVAASLLVLPTEVAQQRLDKIEQAANPAAAAGRAAQPPSKPAGGSTEPGAPAAPTAPGQPATAPSAPTTDARKLGTPVAVTPPETLGKPAGDYPTVNAGDARTGDVVMFTPRDGGEITDVTPARGGLITITYTGATGKPATRNPKLATSLPLLNAGGSVPSQPATGGPPTDVSDARARIATGTPKPGDQDTVKGHAQAAATTDAAAKPYVPTGNMNNVSALSDDQLHAEHTAAEARHVQARAANLPKTSTSYSDSKMAATIFGDEKRKRGLDKPAPAAAEAKPADKPADAVQVPTDAADAAAKIRDEALGITEDPDGVIEVTQEVADRQDRVTALLDAGDTDLGHKTAAALKTDQTDLTDELKLQIELARRDTEHKRAAADAKAASKPKEAAPEPRVRPGVAGAAEDLGDLLNAKTRDADAVDAAAARLSKLLKRTPADSTAFDALHKVIGDGDIHTAITSGALKPGMLFGAAGGLREERRVRRNEGAKRRRVAKRIETDRIKSLLGSVEAELRRRDTGDAGGQLAARARADAKRATMRPGAADRTGPPADSPERWTARQANATARDATSGAVETRQRALQDTDAALTPARRAQLVSAAEKYSAQYGGPDSPTPGADSAARYIVEGHLPDATRAEWTWLANYIESHPDLLTRNPDTATAKDTRPLSERSAEASGHAKAAREAFDAGNHDEATAHLDKAREVAPERNHLWKKIGDHIAANRQGAQSAPTEGGDHHDDTSRVDEPARGDGGAVVPEVPAEGVRGAGEPDRVLQPARRPSPTGDPSGGGEPGRTGPAGGDVRAEIGPPERRPGASDGTGDAPNADERPTPGLAGGRRAAGSDTGPVDAPGGTGPVRGGDAGVQRRGDPAAGGPSAGGDAGTADTPDTEVGHPVTTGQREGAVAVDGDPVLEGTQELPDEQPEADPGQLNAIPDSGENFRPTSAADFAPAGEKAKLEANLAALRTLRQLQTEHRSATSDEQKILARWAGWGGLPKVFDDSKHDYDTQRAELRGLLNPKEWNEARRNTLNAHYTSPDVVQAVWKAMGDLGFDGGRVLEPGSGSGTFIGFAPPDTDMVGVELDSTTAAISRALYPQATIRNESFADTRIPAGSFDAVVGNVPFGDFALADRVHNPGRKHSIHNHFIIKSLAETKPGGITTLLTSRYTLDSKSPAARKQMAEMGDLLGVVRLPTGSHSKTSGTDVIEDILVFRRREPDAPPFTSQDWVHASDRDINGHQITVNDYFTDHPEQILGDLTAEKGRYGTGSMIVRGDKTMEGLPDALARITDSASAAGATSTPRMAGLDALTDPDTNRHEGHIGVDADGGFTQNIEGVSVALKVPDTQAEKLRGLIGLRDTLSSLLTAESKSVSNSPELRELRKTLNDQYDAHTARFGPINRYTLSKSGNRNPILDGGFRNDPMSAIVRALEVFDFDTDTAHKTDIFRKRSVSPREIPTHADTPDDALALSLDTYGEVNLGKIAEMLGVDVAEARARLGDLIFEQPPLSEAEGNAAWKAHIEESDSPGMAISPRFGGVGGTEVGPDTGNLDSVGESVREAGRLEPAAAYLSGNVRRKLAAAKAAAEHDDRFKDNVAALTKVIPTDLGVDDVDGRLGAAWIPAPDVRQFLVDLIHGGDDKYGSVEVATSGGGMWEVRGAEHGTKATEEWGTDRMSAGEIVAHLLEQKSIRIVDTIDKKTYPNLEATTAAQAKAEELSERFSEWLWEDPERTKRLLGNYNNQFNAIRLRSYDDIPRTFPGLSENLTPRPHQVAAVNRIVSEPCALLGHVVGSGKTLEMALGAAELKRLGMAHKPAIVVPNHMLEQVSREYLQAYPNAKILAAGTDDLQGDKRREFVARAATGDWDAVILTQNGMQAIPMSPEAQEAYIERELATMRAQLEAAKLAAEASGDDAQQKTVKKMENAIIKAEEAMKAKLDTAKDVGVSFEQTGIDYVFADEAHMYSNLRTLSNIAGAGASGAGIASDLHMKIEHLRANNSSGRVASFATGTPIRNTVTQAYIMQRFMDPQTLREAGIHSFDQWAATFGQTVDEMELKPEGTGFRQTTRFSRFRNVPELLRLFHKFADIKTAEDLNLPTPKLATGAVQNVVVAPPDSLKVFIQELGRRADAIRNNAPEMRPSLTGKGNEAGEVEDNMLLVSMDGRKAALSMSLVGQEHEAGKVEAAAANIAKIWRETKDRPVPKDLNDPAGGDDPPPGGMQIVFCDMGTPGGKAEWNAYDLLKDKLVAQGMDPKGIRYMHEARNDREKAELFAAARNGAVQVLIGSTEKMGVGTNVQRRAVALHHLDAPWRPSDVEQRDGRIMRQGNSNEEISIFRYVTEGSFDAYMWQTLERKKKFIDQIMRGQLGDAREIEDVGDTALSYAEVKALATGNPMLMDKAKADTVVGKLGRLERQHNRTQTNLRNQVPAYLANAAQSDTDAKHIDGAIGKRTDTDGKNFTATFGGRRFDSRPEAATELQEGIRDLLRDSRYLPSSRLAEAGRKVGSFGGHDLMATPVHYIGRDLNTTLGVDLSWKGLPGTVASLSRDNIDSMGVGIFQTLRNNLDGLEFRRDIHRGRAATLRQEADAMKTRIGTPFAKAAELKAAREESARLQTAMIEQGLDSGPNAEGATAATGLSTARAKASTRAAQAGRSNYNKEERNRLKRFANPAASGPAWASPDGSLAAMGQGDSFTVFDPVDGYTVWRPELPPGQVATITDPEGLLVELQGLGIPLFSHAQYQRWQAKYESPDYSLSYEQREAKNNANRAAASKRETDDKAAMAKVWKRHTATADAPKLTGLDEAQSRAERAATNARSGGDLERILKRFTESSKRIPKYASDDGTIGAVADTSGRLNFFATDNGLHFNVTGSEGPFDDPQAVANDLAALGIPFGDDEARRERWRDRDQRAADLKARTSVFEAHKAAPEEKVLIPAADLARAEEIKALAKGDTPDPEDLTDADQETYADTVHADLRYFMDAGGVLHKVASCTGCGGDVPSPVFNPPASIPCPACGLQMQPMAATVG